MKLKTNEMINVILASKSKVRKNILEQNNIKKGDNVVTAGGMHGKIVLIEKNTVTLEVDRGTKIKFDRNSISSEMSSSN